jgi:sugar lactone lactonase YvrE
MSRTSITAELFYPAAHLLAEGPVWLSRSGQLAYVDITAGHIRLIDGAHPVTATTLPVGDWVSAIAEAADGRLLAACDRGLGLIDTRTASFECLVPPDDHLEAHRYNDGKCDRAGRFIVGTMFKTAPRQPTGRLFSLDGTRRTLLAEGLRTPNALCLSPDGRTLYGCDTADGTIWAFPYDATNGTIGPRRDFASVDVAPGKPDGATVDAEGCVWSARYNGSAVVRLTPDGRVDRVVELPVSQVTSCTFGGPRLDTLYITTARQNLDPEGLARQPLAGSIFALVPGTTGLAETPFANTAAPAA